ncbi:MAG: 30S ribosomal protein S11, small subunit ribosomal protein S11 [Candidatus Peregrinibacteria bacterium GW2011_GWE2_39_6]|nr:MAG: 30S ribosomal protein S11, small subunit ribosomal protein S11 [Candidatus Peregrinibacteria bacterium GW2011_GWF2_39_17]KKR26116.1 MAG: 30S ribosomal protein S11, small subunit ribosomal protein S11 [Candidatus Peregrinibacteria bacterium GW2011_GWE2_39_6]HCW32701.1 30S ribosomal protein S11 [Candidatus Peregrinibacteria bacterium]
MAEAPKKTKTKKKSSRKKINVPEGRVNIMAGYNNTLITITDPIGNAIAWSSSGASGFKGTKKATPYAAQVAAENATEKAKAYGLTKVNVFVKGIGNGREQALRGLIASGLEIQSITDITPVPHNGCRKRRVRRV